MRIAIVLGTRPEIIKMSPVIRECKKRRAQASPKADALGYFIVDTGQHYSYSMNKLFFEELALQQPDYSLGIKPKSPQQQGDHTGRMMPKIESVLRKEKPSLVLVQGDTITVLSGSLCAVKLGIPVGHVEAGLRSYDRTMPEEINRVLSDHISRYLFVPTPQAKENALKEGILDSNIFVTGNTIVDAVQQNLEIASKKLNIVKKLGLEPGGYFLVTAHRQENVDVKSKLEGIMKGLDNIYKEFGKKVLYPMHPRTRKMISRFGIKIPSSISVIEPVGFLEFLQLEKNAKMILTDSGGLQEESCILHVPCITLRENTERPETLSIGNMLAGTAPDKILNSAKTILSKKIKWKNPFGDGRAAEHIMDIIMEGSFK
ncbi:MAG: UDP-N-acetylglucosamine 2-epimerase (non-hydrolyzing) [Candidatus Aenigmarchaeota archaeon]|nr:UDP-N-acetylglucosamine 2-epimerase (non-hydrolyzing) [Candidatus Aenigmarchaeota archaeon]